MVRNFVRRLGSLVLGARRFRGRLLPRASESIANSYSEGSMKPWLAAPLLVGMLLGSAAVPVQAQRSHIGFHGGYNFDLEDGLVGAQFHLPFGRQLEFYPSFDYYFSDPGSLVGFNIDLKLRYPSRDLELYLGGGLNILRASSTGGSNTDTGGNVFAGLETRVGVAHPYFEVRGLLHNTSSVQLNAGINFTLY